MSTSDKLMGLGLRTIGRFAGSKTVDRLKLRKPVERMLYSGARVGFRGAGAVSRSFKATRKLNKAARLPSASRGGLFDLTPTEEQQMLRDAVHDFALEQLRPVAQQADTDCTVPVDLLKQSAELGLTALGVSDALGGVGHDRAAVTNALVAEAMAQGDLAMALACLAPSAVSTALSLWGDADQQARYLPAFTGERPPSAALALMEPQPLFDPFALQSQAVQTPDGYRLDGVKSLVPLAAQAELFVVAARLEGRGPALFVIESGNDGLTVEAEPAMGLRAASTGRLVMDKLQVPKTALLGNADAAVYRDCVQLARVAWCALATGTTQAALDYLVTYVNERTAFGEPISHRQSVAFAVAEIGIALNAMRLLTWRAASRVDQGLDFSREAALARRLCAEKSAMVGSQAVQLLGGHGFVKDHPVERWYRDLRAVGVMEGALLV